MRRSALVSLLLLCLGLGGCSKFAALDALVPRRGYALTSDVAYGPLPRQTLDVYRPKNLKRPAGVVVFFYGGDWQNGRKTDYRFVGQALASRGFVAVLPDYRLYPQVTFPAFVEDGALAVKWTRDHAAEIGGDPSRLFLMGHSAGAHIAALLALDDHYLRDVGLGRGDVRAAALLSGPYNFALPPADRPVFSLAPNQTRPPDAAEPIAFADATAPPLLLVQGDADTTVQPQNAARLAARVRDAGGEVETAFYPRIGHAGVVLALAYPFRWYAPTLGDVADFFNRHADAAAPSRPPPPAAAAPSSAPAPSRRTPG